MEISQTPDRSPIIPVLHRHYLEFNEEGDHLVIRRSKGRNASLRIQIFLASAGIALGVLLYILVIRKGGMALAIGSGIYLVTLMNLREREKESAKKFIRIGNGQVEIKEGYKGSRIDLANVDEIKTSTFRSRDFLIGKINLITKDNKFHQFLETYGKEERLLMSDVSKLAAYLKEHYIIIIDE